MLDKVSRGSIQRNWHKDVISFFAAKGKNYTFTPRNELAGKNCAFTPRNELAGENYTLRQEMSWWGKRKILKGHLNLVKNLVNIKVRDVFHVEQKTILKGTAQKRAGIRKKIRVISRPGLIWPRKLNGKIRKRQRKVRREFSLPELTIFNRMT